MYIPAADYQPHFQRSQTNVERASQCALKGDALNAQGYLSAARQQYAEAVALQPDEGRLHWQLGICEWGMGQVDLAGTHLQAAVRLNPNSPQFQASLAKWYLNLGMIDCAMEATAKSLQLAPQDNEIIHGRAWVLEATGDLDGAWKLVTQLINRGYTPPMLVKLYSRMARWHGQQQSALAIVDKIFKAGNLAAVDQSILHFAAVDLLDSLGRYDAAFTHAARGNALLQPTYNPEAHERVFDRIISYFTRTRLRSLPKSTYLSDKPVFIVGMPRSGTSLIEQILASHPDVHGAGELDFIYRTCLGTLSMLSAAEDDFPEALDQLSLSQADGMSQIYLEPLMALNPQAKRITDKMPLNFLHLGLISILLPQARIIHCRRDPLDTCLSCHMTAFSNGNDFKYNLTHLGRFYRQYERLMAHWRNVLESPMLEITYEELVGDIEGQSRRMIGFLDLPWDDRCLRFYETKRPTVTASTQQIRRPLYSSSVQRWRHYEKHLAPLKEALNPPLH